MLFSRKLVGNHFYMAKINQKKTKVMIFNLTKNYQFTTRLSLNGENVEVVSQTKLLGTIIKNDLTWSSNTANLVKLVT